MATYPKGGDEGSFPGEEEVRPVLDQARSGILLTDAALEPPGPRIVYANPAFEAITGYTRDELRGRSPRMLQGPDTEREVLDRLRAALARGSSFFGRAWNYRRDGSPFVAEWPIAPLRDHAGRLTHFLSVQRDVTAEEHTARSLRESRDLLARTAAVARVGGWEVDPETRAVQWTRIAAEIFEVPDDFEPTVEHILEYYPPGGDREAIQGAVTRALERGEGWDLELGIVTGGGRQRWVRVIGEPQLDAGRCVRLTGTVQDITARRLAEQARREAEERLLRISAHIPGFFYQLRCTGSGEIVELRFVSSGIERLFGIRAEAVRRDPAAWFERVHPEDRAWLETHPPRAWERENWSVRYRIAVAGRPGPQAYHWVEDSATREAVGDDQYLWHGLVMQIGDRKAMEDKLRRQAHYDPLTGLANRMLLRLRLQEEIDRARAGGTGLSVLYLDLDEFKYINDAWGHAVGDRLLRAVADRVAACFRSDDHVARIGGDEMVVLGPGVGSAAARGISRSGSCAPSTCRSSWTKSASTSTPRSASASTRPMAAASTRCSPVPMPRSTPRSTEAVRVTPSTARISPRARPTGCTSRPTCARRWTPAPSRSPSRRFSRSMDAGSRAARRLRAGAPPKARRYRRTGSSPSRSPPA